MLSYVQIFAFKRAFTRVQFHVAANFSTHSVRVSCSVRWPQASGRRRLKLTKGRCAEIADATAR